ncbi:unnamed protein product [Microthlaspi erraticum]|uniref:Uncharacterized protein n=1 Tax=Microthlaspi erraticum TaxID=1685480 RepID=A0A6D2HJ67_9BRAS|nr:unnamed protein product [Microthlaspi erraticum]
MLGSVFTPSRSTDLLNIGVCLADEAEYSEDVGSSIINLRAKSVRTISRANTVPSPLGVIISSFRRADKPIFDEPKTDRLRRLVTKNLRANIVRNLLCANIVPSRILC